MHWYVVAFGWPAPTHLDGPRFETEQAAQLARLERQSEELPVGEGGATWHVLKVEVL